MIPEHGHLYVRYALTNFRNPTIANLFLCLHIMAVRRGWKMEMESRRLDHRMDYVGQVPLLIHIACIWPDMMTDRRILG